MYKLFCSVRVLRRNSSLQYFLVCDCCSLSSGREVLVRVIVGLEEVVVLGEGEWACGLFSRLFY